MEEPVIITYKGESVEVNRDVIVNLISMLGPMRGKWITTHVSNMYSNIHKADYENGLATIDETRTKLKQILNK